MPVLAGDIDFAEFVTLMAHKMADEKSEATLKAAFSVFDTSGDGFISAEEMRRMLRLADRSNVADRRVNPDALMAVGLRKAHDKETRVASVMAGREDRGEFGASQARRNKKSGGTSNVEKKKRKNMPLAARVQAAGRRRRGSAKFGAAKAVKDKQFKGKFRKGANN